MIALYRFRQWWLRNVVRRLQKDAANRLRVDRRISSLDALIVREWRLRYRVQLVMFFGVEHDDFTGGLVQTMSTIVCNRFRRDAWAAYIVFVLRKRLLQRVPKDSSESENIAWMREWEKRTHAAMAEAAAWRMALTKKLLIAYRCRLFPLMTIETLFTKFIMPEQAGDIELIVQDIVLTVERAPSTPEGIDRLVGKVIEAVFEPNPAVKPHVEPLKAEAETVVISRVK